MSIVRRLARPMLAATFIDSGLSILRRPGQQVDQVRPLVARVAGPLHLPADPELFVRVDGAVLVCAASLLALGRMPRLAALALVAGTTPALYGEIAQRREKDPEQLRAHRSELLTRLGLVGGALLAAVDTAGRPGLAWRSRHTAGHLQDTAGHLQDTAGHLQHTAGHLQHVAAGAPRSRPGGVPWPGPRTATSRGVARGRVARGRDARGRAGGVAGGSH